MENLLIEIYLFVCRVYDTSSKTCFQRLSNNREPDFTDQELITIWLFAHFRGLLREKENASLDRKVLASVVSTLTGLPNIRPTSKPLRADF